MGFIDSLKYGGTHISIMYPLSWEVAGALKAFSPSDVWAESAYVLPIQKTGRDDRLITRFPFASILMKVSSEEPYEMSRAEVDKARASVFASEQVISPKTKALKVLKLEVDENLAITLSLVKVFTFPKTNASLKTVSTLSDAEVRYMVAAPATLKLKQAMACNPPLVVTIILVLSS